MQVQRSTFLCLIITLLLLSLMLVSCGESVGGNGKSPVFLVASGGDVVGMQIDVYDPTYPGGVADDFFEVTIKSIYKNQSDPPNTTFADVILQEYRVTYYRADGNTNVPDPFLVQLSGIIPAGGEYELNLLLVRSDAKLKSPLKELAFGGGEGEIHLQAVIDFFGEDLMGNHVSTTMVVIIDALDS